MTTTQELERVLGMLTDPAARAIIERLIEKEKAEAFRLSPAFSEPQR